jgi:transcriptional regulator with XRE-family HTH domain
MTLKKQIGSAIKEERKRQGMTMRQLADRIGVTGINTISRYESGSLNLSADLIEKICSALDCSLEILLKPQKEVTTKL